MQPVQKTVGTEVGGGQSGGYSVGRHNWWIMPTGIIALLIMMVIRPYDFHGENFYYWMFARAFHEIGVFPIPDRSPISVLYLNLFLPLGFPYSTIAEEMVRDLLVLGAFALFFRPYYGVLVGLSAAAIWLIFLNLGAPFGQSIGLALLLIAAALRRKRDDPAAVTGCYLLLFLANAFRPTYSIAILLFVFYDFYRWGHDYKFAFPTNFLSKIIYPLIAIVLWFSMSAWITSSQWQSPANNTYGFENENYPYNTKNLFDTNLVSAFATLRLREFPNAAEMDILSHTEELLGSARTATDVLRKSAHSFFVEFDKNVPEFLHAVWLLTFIPKIKFAPHISAAAYALTEALVFFSVILYIARLSPTRLYPVLVFLGSAATVLPKLLIIASGERHYAGFVPVLVFAGFWFGDRVTSLLRRDERPGWDLLAFLAAVIVVLLLRMLGRATHGEGIHGDLAVLVVAVVLAGGVLYIRRKNMFPAGGNRSIRPVLLVIGLVLFSHSPFLWGHAGKEILSDLIHGRISIMEPHDAVNFSTKRAFESVEPMLEGCAGVIANEAIFWNAFSKLPLGSFHSPLELPAAGRYGETPVNLLDPTVVNCVIDNHAHDDQGLSVMNLKKRWRDYVYPYITELKNRGAGVHHVDRVGDVIILRNKPI
ncbi:MAG: hypothetical protein HQL07_09040 [Nitrospirae bacterium]|nr:hypothetical protein [Magnetococcales bacterium]